MGPDAGWSGVVCPRARRPLCLAAAALGTAVVCVLLAAPASATVDLVTVGPGSSVETMFGHSGLRLRDSGPSGERDLYVTLVGDVSGSDGAFRFVSGQSGFRWVVQPTARAYGLYVEDSRFVREQTLALEPAEERDLRVALDQAIGKGTVSYGLIHGNCAGLVADLLEDAVPAFVLGPAPERSVADSGTTYAKSRPWMHLGLHFALGTVLDSQAPYPMVPAELHAAVGGMQRPDGTPMVVASRTVAEGVAPERGEIFPTLVPGIALVSLSIASLGLARASPAKARFARRLASAPLVGIGLVGLLVLLLALLPRGPVTFWNPVLLWAWPTHLALPWIRQRRWWPQYHAVALAAAGAALVSVPVRDIQTPWSLTLLMVATVLALVVLRWGPDGTVRAEGRRQDDRSSRRETSRDGHVPRP